MGADSLRSSSHPLLAGHEARVKSLDSRLETDRRLVGERVAEILRWIFVTVIAVLNNFAGSAGGDDRLLINAVLAAWAITNLVITGLLLRGYCPGRQFGLSTTAIDIVVGSSLVYFSAGFASPYFLALFVAIIASSVRLGTAASVATAGTIVLLYLFAGGAAPFNRPVLAPGLGLEVLGRVLLFMVVALVSGTMARELIRSRRRAIEWAAQAESLHEVTAAMASSLQVMVEALTRTANEALQETVRQQRRARWTESSEPGKSDILHALAHDLHEPLIVLDSYIAMIRSHALGELPPVVEEAIPELTAKLREIEKIIDRIQTAKRSRATVEVRN